MAGWSWLCLLGWLAGWLVGSTRQRLVPSPGALRIEGSGRGPVVVVVVVVGGGGGGGGAVAVAVAVAVAAAPGQIFYAKNIQNLCI